VGVLTTDLSCPAGPGYCVADPLVACATASDCPSLGCRLPPGVTIEHRGVLDLNGHTLASGHIAALCRGRRCEIHGPGTLAADVDGVAVLAGKRLGVRDLSVSGDGGGVWSALSGPVTASNVDISLGPVVAIQAGTLRGSGISVTGGGNAIEVPEDFGGPLAGTTVFFASISVTKMRADDVSVADSFGNGIEAARGAKGANVSTIDGVGHGIQVQRGRLKIDGLTATGNGAAGVRNDRGAVKIFAGTLTGNGGVYENVDIASVRMPSLDGASLCNKSGRIDRQSGEIVGTWGVCSGD
jgi:hypothetical protein